MTIPEAEDTLPQVPKAVAPADLPVPARRGIFTSLSPAQFRTLVRKAQGFTDAQSAHEAGIRKKTVSSYIDTCRLRLGVSTSQELIWAYYAEYAPVLLYGDGDESSGPALVS